MADRDVQQPPPRGIVKIVSTGFVALAAVVALIAQLPGAIGAWCDYFGFLCTYPVAPVDISAFVPPGNPCGNGWDGPRKICLTPGPYRRLVVSSLKFVPANPLRSGYIYDRFNDGDPAKKPPGAPFSGSGWYPLPDNDSKQICVMTYAATGGCEYKFGINGTINARERVTIF